MTITSVPPQRIRLKAAAESLGVARYTLNRWARAGLITYYLVGQGNYMEFDPRDIEAFALSWKRERKHPPVE